MRHAHMVRIRDAVIATHHKGQLAEAEWQLRHAHDPRLLEDVMAAIANQQAPPSLFPYIYI